VWDRASESAPQPDAGTLRSAAPSLADVTPFAVVVTALAAVADAPATRRSRRIVTVGEQTTVTQVPAAAPAAAPAPVPVDASPLEPVLAAAEPFELLEPAIDAVATPGVEDELVPEPVVEDAASGHAAASDAFEAAARLFSFTGETPIQSVAADTDAGNAPAAVHVASRRSRGASFQRITATSFSVGVMGIVGLLTVGLTTPADAVAVPGGTDISTSLVAAAGDVPAGDAGEIQAYVTPAEVQNATIERAENYSTLTMAQLASQSGIANYSNFFINDPNSPIQWPFAVGVPISYGFGMRDGTMHEGADFTPGEGSPIQAIADGVVRESTESGGAFGVHIVIDHIIDGQLISSSYSHMLYGSRQVQVGDHVTVGTVIGHTGNTGRSFGAHTHFEMLANGTTPIDPIPWLRAHAGG
jgi:murein DD-endopeptidase MepM/ murein hydrolase activator NlpD